MKLSWSRCVAGPASIILLFHAGVLGFGPHTADAVCTYPLGWTRPSSPGQYRNLSQGAIGYPQTYVFSVAGDPTDPHGLFAGSYNDLARSPDCGQSWVHFAGGIGAGSITIGPNGLMYIVAAEWLLRSTDAGQTWHNVEQRSGQGRSSGLLLAPSDPTVLYQIGYVSLTFNEITGSLRTLRRLVIAPNDDAQVSRPWELMHAARPPGAVLVDPVDAATLYILGETERWVSRDSGRTFEAESMDPAPAQPPFQAARLAPDGSRVWAVDAAQQVLVSYDLGLTWSVRTTLPLGEDVTFLRVNDLNVSPFDPSLVFLALHVQPDYDDHRAASLQRPSTRDRNGLYAYLDVPLLPPGE